MTLPCKTVTSVVDNVLYCNVESIKLPFLSYSRRNCLVWCLNRGYADHIIDFVFTRNKNLQFVWICPNIKRRHKIIELHLFNLAASGKNKGLISIGIKTAKCSFPLFYHQFRQSLDCQIN